MDQDLKRFFNQSTVLNEYYCLEYQVSLSIEDSLILRTYSQLFYVSFCGISGGNDDQEIY